MLIYSNLKELTVPLSPLSIINKVDIQGRCIKWYIFVRISFAPDIFRTPWWEWLIFPGQYSHFRCIFLAIVAGICSWCAFVSDSKRCWLWPGIMMATSKEKGSIRSMAGTDLSIFLNCTCRHCMHICSSASNLGFKNPNRNNDFICWRLCVAKMRWAWLT